MSEQLYMRYRTFDPLGDPTYKPGFKQRSSDWLIMLRSKYTHTTLQFPDETHGGISASASMRGGHNCFRFIMNNYTKHPKRWKTVLIPVTREQVDLMFAEACRMADMDIDVMHDMIRKIESPYTWNKFNTFVYYGPNALKYDLLGLLSFATRWEIIRPHSKWVFCTEAVFRVLKVGFSLELATAIPSKFHPQSGHERIKLQFGKA